MDARLRDRLTRQLDKWRDELINLDRRNRVLYFRHTKSASFEIDEPDSDQIAQGIAAGWTFLLPPEPVEDELGLDVKAIEWQQLRRRFELRVRDKTRSELLAGLRRLERLAQQDYVDKGLWTLYLGLDALRWRDPAATDTTPQWVDSPLLLVPVTFGRTTLQEPFRLQLTGDDPVINPALTVKLSTDFGIELPTVDDEAELDPAGVRRAVAAAVRRQKEWTVAQRAVLTTFTFHKEAMYRDLKDNAEKVAEHPTVQLLALGPDAPAASSLDFAEMPDDEIDDLVPPEELLNILDADSTQRKAILAARESHSFVIDGPPGTGKSQTIANIIAELMAQGRKILFVSEKAAALDVVFKRLEEAKLSDFLLQLHSHQATRKAVATELGRVLSQRTNARSTNNGALRARLASARKQLSSYALAMNEVRRPLAMSLHVVVGKIAALHDSPHAPVPRSVNSELDLESFNEIVNHAEVLGRHWAPVAKGDDFLWRDLRDTTASVGRQHELAQLVETAASVQRALRRTAQQIADELRVRWHNSVMDVERLCQLLRLCDDRPAIPAPWLTHQSMAPMEQRVLDRRNTVQAHKELADQLENKLGAGWIGLDSALGPPALRALDGCRSESPSFDPGGISSLDELSSALTILRAAAGRVDALEADGWLLAQAFGARWSELTVDRVATLSELAQIADAEDRPEVDWLNPGAIGSVERAARVLGGLVADFRTRQESLATTFTPAVLQLDLPGLHARFTQIHTGLGRLRKQYRDDKRTLASATVVGKVNRRTIAQLPDAVAWSDVDKRLSDAETEQAERLGSYYDRERADFGRIVHAIETARRALQLAGDEMEAERLTQQLSRTRFPERAVVTAGDRSAQQLELWRRDVGSVLGGPAASAVNAIPLRDAAAYLDRLINRLSVLVETKRTVDAITATALPVETVVDVAVASHDAARLREELEQNRLADNAVLGPGYAGLDTNWDALAAALSWTRDVRQLLGGPASGLAAEALLITSYRSEQLTGLLQETYKRDQELLQVFGDARAERLRADLHASFDDAADLLQQLATTTSDIDVWSQHTGSLEMLNDAGLEPVTRFCVDNRVPADQVPRIVERAVLEAWADDVIATDHQRLSPLRARERDMLVDQFHELDQALVAGACAHVVNACAARRPTSLAGAAGVIAREAEKRSRHMSIRQLLKRAGTVAQQLKPCFMMSPLSVSQYLPPDLEFDVVIFDEASQVRPSDAINCVYRANQLIVAGDDKQLPPSNFFQVMGADEDDAYDAEATEDFESVLGLSKGSGSVRSLPLLWHYRSQHEDLIAYSNYRFYKGDLFTFPSAAQQAQDLGIEVFKVDGVYRRGSSRDNPVEAGKVVERVLFHVRQHPELTVGVVTFSAAQEDAIEAELERQAAIYPELQGLMGGDRLRGFFIKNLENVQGDERDVIIFSVGYGPDENGKFTLNLGPLNRSGGWRRLNVAITRARRRVEIVTSVSPGDFGTNPTTEGIRHLRNYLDFGMRGPGALALDLEESQGDAESLFEEEVLRVIQGWGYAAVPQVGLAGYRIDIGVKDPRDPGRYILAVECDGAMYHSAKAARDRDRLRQMVIERLGWRVHRIWGTSWFRDRVEQEARLRAAIDDAQHGDCAARHQAQVSTVEVTHDEIDFEAPPSWTTPYRLVQLPQPRYYGEMHEPDAQPDLSRFIQATVNIEGPVQVERVLRAVREAWGVGRAGHRIRANFDEVVSALRRRGLIDRDRDDFLRKPGIASVRVRVPTEDPATRRRATEVPPEELDLAVQLLVTDAHAIEPTDLIVRVARLFGWERTGSEITYAIEDSIARLQQGGHLTSGDDGQLRVP